MVLPLAGLASGCGWLVSPLPVRVEDEPRLSHVTFERRAEAACARRSRELAALPRPRTKAERRAFFHRVARIERVEAAALAELHPPRAAEREFARLLGASVELAEVAQRFVAALAADDVHERRRAVADADRASAAYDRAARRLRLACRQAA